MRYVEDPRIASVAQAEYASMMTEIIRRYKQGGDWFHERTVVVAERGPQIAKLYGKDVAERAIRNVMSHGPSDVTASVAAERNAALAHPTIQEWDDLHGPGHHFTPLQQFGRDNPKLGGFIAELSVFFVGLAALLFFPMSIAYGWSAGFHTLYWCAGASVTCFVGGLWIDGLQYEAPKKRKDAPVLTWDELKAHRERAEARKDAEMRARWAADAKRREEQEEYERQQRETKATLARIARSMERENRIRKGGKW